MRWFLVALSCIAAIPLAAQSQSPPSAQGPTFRTGVDVITVDVAAVDSNGKPVAGLLAPEFVVRVDGQPRKVVSVEEVKADAAVAQRRPDAEPFESFFSTNITPPEGRLIVIAVDELNIRPGNVRPLLNTAARFVDNLGPNDSIAFYAYPQPGAFVDFTSDKPRIRRAMETVVGNQVPYQGRFNIGLYEAVQVMLKQDERIMARVTQRECRRAAGNALELCEQEILSDMSRMVAKVRDDRHQSLRGLQELLARLRLIEGPKSLIVVSEGLVLEDPTDLDDTVRQAALSQASVNVLMMDVMRGSDMASAVMPPTASEDRELQMEGLREMAFASRGALYNVFGNGEAVFNRLASELSAYYLLGVEADPRDRDDRAHRIDVEVRRRGVTLRSRRAFVLSSPRDVSPAERLSEVLFSPFGVPEVPLRITTFAMQDPAGGSKIQVLLAADVGQAGSPPARYTVGWALIDQEGKAVVTGAESRLLQPMAGRTDTALDFSTVVRVDPGVYSLRFGAVDETGRRGSVVREVNAWKLLGEEFAVADLVIGRVPASGSVLVAGIEPRIEDDLAAVIEVYSTVPGALDRTVVTFEIADNPEGPALVMARGDPRTGAHPTARTVQTVLGARSLPPGRYVVRARVTRDGSVAGMLVRPFVLDAPSAAAGAAPVAAVRLSFAVPRFDRTATLAPALLKAMFDAVERRTPALKGALAEARAGRYGPAALEALSEESQDVAAFMRGLDLYSRGQLDQAANQLNIAAGPRREFFPAAFFLGAVFASAGRDRDAAAVWQMGIGTEPRPSLAYTLFADARLRDNQPQSVVDVLLPAWQRTPQDDEMARRLATALVLAGKHAEAVPVADAFLTRHPDDQDILVAAIVAQYEVTSRAGLSLSAADRAKLTRYERAYRGPQKALVAKYVETLTAR